MNTPPWDVVIGGGGMVGLSLALALDTASGGGLRILVAEQAPLPENSPTRPDYRASFDARSTALSRSSELILRELGLWQDLAAHTASIAQIHVSQRGRVGSAVLAAAEQGWPALGHVVENAWLGAVLLAAVGRRPGISVSGATVLDAPRVHGDVVHLHRRRAGSNESLQTPLRTRLLCIADGADSPLAASLGFAFERHDYGGSALIANVASTRPHAGWAYERFTDSGPLALLPLPSDGGRGRSAVIWSLPGDRAEACLQWSAERFLSHLQHYFGYRQGRLLEVGERSLYPLRRSLATEQVRRRVVVMGNAAHALHPVAGQGFNLALRDAARLAQCAAGAEDPGELSALSRYRCGQRVDQWRTAALSHYLPWLFELRAPGLGGLRGAGLGALDLAPGLRRRFVDWTAGCAPGSARSVYP